MEQTKLFRISDRNFANLGILMFIQCRDIIRTKKCKEFKWICNVAEHLGPMQIVYVNTDFVFVRCIEFRLHVSFLWFIIVIKIKANMATIRNFYFVVHINPP